MLTPRVCPNCDGERVVAGDQIDTDRETGEAVYAAEMCRVCGGRGGFGELREAEEHDAAAE